MVSENVERLKEPHRAGSVFNAALDRMLRLDRGDRVAKFASVRTALARFPELERHDRVAMLRRIAYRDAANRIVFRSQMLFPKVAMAVARLVRIDGPRDLHAAVPLEQPIVLALPHLGPIYAAITVAMRLLRGRRVFIFHAGGEHGHAVSRYFKKIGAIPIVNERGSLAAVMAAVKAAPASAVIFCYDHLGSGGTQSIPFLGDTITVPTGLARLAEATRAAVIVGCWDASLAIPYFSISAGPAFDRSLEVAERQDAFMANMFALLEGRVRKTPHAWTEWQNC